MPDALSLDLVPIVTSLTIGTRAVHITLSGILRLRSCPEDLLIRHLAWMRQPLIREETSVKRLIDGTST